MEGMCKCGGRIRERNHKVFTPQGAADWIEDFLNTNRLPINVEQSECQSCGRTKTVIRDNAGKILDAWGLLAPPLARTMEKDMLTVKLETLNNVSKKLKETVEHLGKQSAIHTPIAFYITKSDFSSAVSAAARQAKKEESEVTITYQGIPVKVL